MKRGPDPRALESAHAAVQRLDRSVFVPRRVQHLAQFDEALPIGSGQTISQPSLVALMSALVDPGPGKRILEVGTGSGFQAAVLAELGAEVFTVEIHPELSERAERALRRLGYQIHFRIGDGGLGWPEEAPFDAVVVTAAAREVPPALKEQLSEGGALVIPVGAPGSFQRLLHLTRAERGFDEEEVTMVRFVPLTGQAGSSDDGDGVASPL